jgi:hypothetical protein
MSLADGLLCAMQARRMRPAQVIALLPAGSHAQFYRALNGWSPDVRLDRLCAYCRALDCDPTALLQQAGLWPRDPPPADALDRALLRALCHIEALPAREKAWALATILALLQAAPSRSHTPS